MADLVNCPYTKEELEALVVAVIDEEGREWGNPIPVSVDVTPRPLTIKEQIKRLLRVELAARAEAQDAESFEEANDFEVEEEDGEPLSGYEVVDMVEEVPRPGGGDAPSGTEPSGSPEGNPPPASGDGK